MNFNRTSHHRSVCALSACLIAIFGLNPSANAGDIIHVKASASCPGDGIGWATAYKYLQDALTAAEADDQIWVAAGTYRVDQSCANQTGTGDREETFQLVKDVFLLGGFKGTEIDASQRDPVENETFLSGVVYPGDPFDYCEGGGNECGTGGSCFDGNGGMGCIDSTCCQLVCALDPGCCCFEWDDLCAGTALEVCGDAYHVVTAGSEIDDPDNTLIDGFIITDGWATGDGTDEDHGGGMFIQGEPSVARCTFKLNTASEEGGGMTIKGDSIQPHIINCMFQNNPSNLQPVPKNGGGLASIAADPMFTNCLFKSNTAKTRGGAIYNIAGCLGIQPPGGVCGRITLINCTVAYNSLVGMGGGATGAGLFFDGDAGQFKAENTIVWANIPDDDQIDGVITVVNVNFSDCAGGCPGMGMGNLNVDPLFLGGAADLRLSLLSPVIDEGNPVESVIPCDFFNLDNDAFDCTFMAEEPTPDLDLFNRVLDGDEYMTAIVDMGAYEFCHPDICPWDLDDDGMVGASDLLLLLANWGDPYGAAELLALLAAWGACPCFSVEPPSLQEELDDACLTEDDWDDFVDVMTDPESSEADKDRYLCWMTHYLEDCNKCICIGQSGCPNPDPFD